MIISLSVSIVTYNPDMELLDLTLSSLAEAVGFAAATLPLSTALCLVDNGPGIVWQARLAESLRLIEVDFPGGCRLLSGHGNPGYGQAHNLGASEYRGEFHLVLNPDVVLEEDAILQALMFFSNQPGVGLLAPQVSNLRDEPQFLCKNYPTVFVLALRAFAPTFLKNILHKKLDTHELRALSDEVPTFDVTLVSGCFMFCRCQFWDMVGGFSSDYFMYFEDYDLSIRIGRVAQKVFVPAVRIKHAGGSAAQKGVPHIIMFVRSAIKFFNQHGWRWF